MKPSILTICELVAAHYEVTVAQMLSPDRSKSVNEARQIAMWITRHRLPLSFPEIGREFGRDHSTVMSAVTRIDRATGRTLETRRELYAQVDAVQPRKCGEWSDATGARTLTFATGGE